MLDFIISVYADFFVWLSTVLGGYGAGVIALSFLSALAMAPLVRRAEKTAALERSYQDVLGAQIKQLKRDYKGDAYHTALRALYRRYSYHPFYAIRQVMPLFVQLPFLIVTYFMLTELPQLMGQGFLFIPDLGSPDGLMSGINVLPFVMTGANILAALTLASAGRKELAQTGLIALIFLVLLYNANAGILLYWTVNNLILLGRNIWANPNAMKRLSVHVDGRSLYARLPDISLFLAYALLFLAIQAWVELTSVSSTPSVIVRKIIFFGGGSLGLTVAAIVLRRFAITFNIVAVAFGVVLLLGGLLFVFMSEVRQLMTELVALAFYFDLWPVYLAPVALFVFIAVLAFRLIPKQDDFSQKRYLTFSVAAVISGLAFHWLNNSEYIFLGTIAPYFLAGALGALGVAIICLPLARGLSGSIPWEITGAVLLFAFVMLPTVHAYLIWSSHYGEYLLIVAVLFVFLNYLNGFGEKAVFRFFAIFFGVNLLLLALGGGADDEAGDKSMEFAVRQARQAMKQTADLRSALPRPAETPNIYFLVSESMPDLNTLGKLGVDPKPLGNLLREFDFKVYDDTYTLGRASLLSMSKTLGLKEGVNSGDAMRQIIGGHSLTNLWLQDIGYQTSIVTKLYLTGVYNAYDGRYPNVSVEVGQYDFLLMLLKGIGMREFRFDIKGLKKYSADIDLEALKREVISRKKSNPFFMLFHGELPKHSQNSGKCLPDETERFIMRYHKALENLKKDFQTIKKHDPNAIIVLMGDHGPFLTLNCHELRFVDPHDVTELHVRDRIGTIFAVHWPNLEKALKYDEDILINQDIVPLLLSYLHDSSLPMSLKMKRRVEIGGRVLENGKLLPIGN